jgi:AcrR family transcriptional regulator
MARTKTVNVLDVLAAARGEFARRGLRRALMSDIARAAGVSAGTLYNVAVSKEALFAAVFLDSGEAASRPLPLAEPSGREIVVAVADRLTAAMSLPLLDEALRRPRANDIELELRGIVGERYDAIASCWQLLAVVEQTAKDIPEAAAAYYDGGRSEHVDTLGRYLRQRTGVGQVRPVPPAAAARFMIEAVAWWAWHRHEDQRQLAIADDDARALVQDMTAAALAVRAG